MTEVKLAKKTIFLLYYYFRQEELIYLTLVLMGGRGFDSIHLFKEIFAQPKLEIKGMV